MFTHSKKRSLKNIRLYLILDKPVCGSDIKKILTQAIKGGIDIVQFRDKFASAKEMIKNALPLLTLARQHNIPFIINDRLDVALAVNADGLHIGQDDTPVDLARKLLGKNKLLGLSCHCQSEIKEAQNKPIDYCGFGPVFKTATKPHLTPRGLKNLRNALKISHKPVFAIGGVCQKNLALLKKSGVKRIAVCRDICLAKDIFQTTKTLKERL